MLERTPQLKRESDTQTRSRGSSKEKLSPPQASFADFSPALGASPVQLQALDTALLQFRESVAGRTALAGPMNVQAVASEGIKGGGDQLPHFDRIQAAFGSHDISGIRAHVGSEAKAATGKLGAKGYATGNDVVLRDTSDLHTAAHEAAHVVQQRGGVQLSGGVGQAGDRYEQHADAVADAVVSGRSAEGLLNGFGGGASGATSGVQLKGLPDHKKQHGGPKISRKDQREHQENEKKKAAKKAADKKSDEDWSKNKKAGREKQAEDAKKETLTDIDKSLLKRLNKASAACEKKARGLVRQIKALEKEESSVNAVAVQVEQLITNIQDLGAKIKGTSKARADMQDRHKDSPRKAAYSVVQRRVRTLKTSLKSKLKWAESAESADFDFSPKGKNATRRAKAAIKEARKALGALDSL